MKHLFFLLSVALLTIGSLTAQSSTSKFRPDDKPDFIPEGVTPDSTGYLVHVGQQAPDFEFTLTDGTTQRLSDLRGRVVMLQFTASWCGVCRREMPFIESDIWQRHKDHPDFYLMGIDRAEPLDVVKAFGQKVGITYPLVLDPEADIYALYALRRSGITRNVLIDRNGTIVHLTRLYSPEEFQGLVAHIDALLHD